MATKLEELQQRKAKIDEETRLRKEELKKEAQQRKAKLNKVIAREKSKAKNAQRNEDTRRKILIGSYILQSMEKTGIDVVELGREKNPSFKNWLTRPDDRALFGLLYLESQESLRQE